MDQIDFYVEQPNSVRNEIERLEAEIFILKNENATLKSKQNSSLNNNIERRLTALEDISNRFVNQNVSYGNQSKRRRKYRVNDDEYSD